MPEKDLSDHKFWAKQPVIKPRPDEQTNEPIDSTSQALESEFTATPLPTDFEWCDLNLSDSCTLKEFFEFLFENYIEDSSSSFKLLYSEKILHWALIKLNTQNGFVRGIRSRLTGQLIATIAATVEDLVIRGKIVKASIVDFLCVIRSLRSKRLSPVLIREITRISHINGIFQALHTGSISLPTCVCSPTYYHRFLNAKKLLEAEFCALPQNISMNLFLKMHKTPSETIFSNIRPMRFDDVRAVTDLLNEYFKDVPLHKVFTEVRDTDIYVQTFVTQLITQKDVIYSYVVEDNGNITDFCSFYTLHASSHSLQKGNSIKIAMLYYYAHTSSLDHLMHDLTFFACREGFDVINALNNLNLPSIFKNQKYVLGTGILHYYLYNWRCAKFDINEVICLFYKDRILDYLNAFN